MNALDSLSYFIPETILLGGAFLTLVADLFIKNKRVLGVLSLIVIAATIIAAKNPYHASHGLFFGFFVLDGITHFFRYAALGVVGMTILSSFAYKPLSEDFKGEYYSLLLFMAFALILMASSTNLLMIFMAVEFVSLLSYLLVGFLRKDAKSKEAAIKYLLYGAVASGAMLYGMSLLFGITGSLQLAEIKTLVTGGGFNSLALVSLIFILVGIGFKISMAPFHMWAPDVYEAAPTPITALLTVGPKAVGFALLIRMLTTGFHYFSAEWTTLLAFLAMLTMTLGNVIAITQHNIKRLMAFSSVAQAGYILMGLAVYNKTGLAAILLYLAAYAVTNLGAFAVIIAASGSLKSENLRDYAGLAKKSPLLAASLTIFLLSLAGIPPLAGFLGKFYVFAGAVEGKMVTLLIVAVINSAVAVYYYFRIVKAMYLVPANNDTAVKSPLSLSFAVLLMLVGTLAIGLMPAPLIDFIQTALVL